MVEAQHQINDWIPSTEAERNEVRVQLEQILASPLFRNSKRYPNLLRYLVEQTLAGKEDLLKERLLGITVFHRAPDYDTNQDTVVRLTAGEIRKRIAQYFHQPENSGQLQIDLRPGSYVPVFRRPVPQSVRSEVSGLPSKEQVVRGRLYELVAGQPLPVSQNSSSSSGKPETGSGESETSHQSMPQQETAAQAAAQQHFSPSRSTDRATRKMVRFRLWCGLMAVASLAVSAGAFAWWYASRFSHTSQHQLWAPILQEPGQALLVIADLSASLNHPPGTPGNQTGELSEILRMGEMVNYRDSLAQSGIVAFLSQHNKPYTLELSTQANYPDLQRGASVLIGGLDNVWTMRLTEPLRYHFVRRGTTYAFAIEDRQHPDLGGWNVDLSQPADRDVEDYAIVARIFDQTTGRPVLVVAGLGANGTAAAAKFLLDPARTAELNDHAPSDWQRLNMEAVLRTQILDNHPGPPHLVACTFW